MENALKFRIWSGIFTTCVGVPGIVLFSYLYVSIAFYIGDTGGHGDYYLVFDPSYLALHVTLYSLIGFFIFPLILGSSFGGQFSKKNPPSIIKIIVVCLIIFPVGLLLCNFSVVFPNQEFLEQISFHTNLAGHTGFAGRVTDAGIPLFTHIIILPPADSRYFGLSLWAQQSLYSLPMYIAATWIFLKIITSKSAHRA